MGGFALCGGLQESEAGANWAISIRLSPAEFQLVPKSPGAALSSTQSWRLIDLSPKFHPAMSRARRSFEPFWLGDATGRGAKPPVERSVISELGGYILKGSRGVLTFLPTF